MRDNVSRRDVLKSVGATGAATLTSNVVSAKGKVDREKLESIQSKDKVQSVLREINHPTLRHKQSKKHEVVGDEGNTLTMYSFETKFGKLVYGESDNSESAIFKFSSREGQENEGSHRRRRASKRDHSRRKRAGSRGQLPQKYDSVPIGTNAMLLGTDTDVIFRRHATDSEIALANQISSIDISDATATVGSDIDGFRVMYDAESGDSQEVSTLDITVEEGVSYSPTRDLSNQLSPRQLSMESDGITAQWHESCVPACGGCVMNIAKCYRCSPACSTSGTGVGAVACAVYLYFWCHGMLAATCGACLHCVEDDV